MAPESIAVVQVLLAAVYILWLYLLEGPPFLVYALIIRWRRFFAYCARYGHVPK